MPRRAGPPTATSASEVSLARSSLATPSMPSLATPRHQQQLQQTVPVFSVIPESPLSPTQPDLFASTTRTSQTSPQIEKSSAPIAAPPKRSKESVSSILSAWEDVPAPTENASLPQPRLSSSSSSSSSSSGKKQIVHTSYTSEHDSHNQSSHQQKHQKKQHLPISHTSTGSLAGPSSGRSQARAAMSSLQKLQNGSEFSLIVERPDKEIEDVTMMMDPQQSPSVDTTARPISSRRSTKSHTRNSTGGLAVNNAGGLTIGGLETILASTSNMGSMSSQDDTRTESGSELYYHQKPLTPATFPRRASLNRRKSFDVENAQPFPSRGPNMSGPLGGNAPLPASTKTLPNARKGHRAVHASISTISAPSPVLTATANTAGSVDTSLNTHYQHLMSALSPHLHTSQGSTNTSITSSPKDSIVDLASTISSQYSLPKHGFQSDQMDTMPEEPIDPMLSSDGTVSLTNSSGAPPNTLSLSTSVTKFGRPTSSLLSRQSNSVRQSQTVLTQHKSTQQQQQGGGAGATFGSVTNTESSRSSMVTESIDSIPLPLNSSVMTNPSQPDSMKSGQPANDNSGCNSAEKVRASTTTINAPASTTSSPKVATYGKQGRARGKTSTGQTSTGLNSITNTNTSKSGRNRSSSASTTGLNQQGPLPLHAKESTTNSSTASREHLTSSKSIASGSGPEDRAESQTGTSKRRSTVKGRRGTTSSRASVNQNDASLSHQASTSANTSDFSSPATGGNHTPVSSGTPLKKHHASTATASNTSLVAPQSPTSIARVAIVATRGKRAASKLSQSINRSILLSPIVVEAGSGSSTPDSFLNESAQGLPNALSSAGMDSSIGTLSLSGVDAILSTTSLTGRPGSSTMQKQQGRTLPDSVVMDAHGRKLIRILPPTQQEARLALARSRASAASSAKRSPLSRVEMISEPSGTLDGSDSTDFMPIFSHRSPAQGKNQREVSYILPSRSEDTDTSSMPQQPVSSQSKPPHHKPADKDIQTLLITEAKIESAMDTGSFKLSEWGAMMELDLDRKLFVQDPDDEQNTLAGGAPSRHRKRRKAKEVAVAIAIELDRQHQQKQLQLQQQAIEGQQRGSSDHNTGTGITLLVPNTQPGSNKYNRNNSIDGAFPTPPTRPQTAATPTIVETREQRRPVGMEGLISLTRDYLNSLSTTYTAATSDLLKMRGGLTAPQMNSSIGSRRPSDYGTTGFGSSITVAVTTATAAAHFAGRIGGGARSSRRPTNSRHQGGYTLGDELNPQQQQQNRRGTRSRVQTMLSPDGRPSSGGGTGGSGTPLQSNASSDCETNDSLMLPGGHLGAPRLSFCPAKDDASKRSNMNISFDANNETEPSGSVGKTQQDANDDTNTDVYISFDHLKSNTILNSLPTTNLGVVRSRDMSPCDTRDTNTRSQPKPMYEHPLFIPPDYPIELQKFRHQEDKLLQERSIKKAQLRSEHIDVDAIRAEIELYHNHERVCDQAMTELVQECLALGTTLRNSGLATQKEMDYVLHLEECYKKKVLPSMQPGAV